MDLHEDNRESEHRRLSGKASEPSPQPGKYRKDTDGSAGDAARSRTRDPARDPDRSASSEADRSSSSFYSDDYENVSHSDQSLSPRSSSPSPRRQDRSKRLSVSPSHPTGARKAVTRRPPPQSHNPQHRSGGMRSHSLSKDAPSKDIDPVTKRMMSARLLKINELKNALSELRLHADELQRENRLLRQLQVRQEKALHRYNDTESEISQLLSRHNNETHVLRERLRRSQESQRAAERSLRETDAQLQRSRGQLQKLQRLADDQNLGEREELSRKLVHTQTKLQDSEHRVKELEKNMELSSGSFQRQLANERKRTHDTQQEVKTLQEEVERLCIKVKEKEKELEARNIYANRMLKASSRREADHSSSRKGTSTSITKAVQTEDRTPSLDFPSPPPAVSSELQSNDHTDDYLLLKDHHSREKRQREANDWKIQEFWREREKEREMESERMKEREKEILPERKTERLRDEEKQQISHERNSRLLKNATDRQEEDWRFGSVSQKKEESRRQHEPEDEEQKARNQEIQPISVEEDRQRKEQLLAKMREIDLQTQGHDSDFFSDDTGSVRSPPRLSEPRNQNGIFKLTDQEETVNTLGSGRRGAGIRTQRASEDLDLTFGSYAPSFGKSAPRAGLGLRNTNQNSNPEPLQESDGGGLDLGPPVKDRKSNLMQQLFGPTATSPPSDTSRRMEISSPPLTAHLPSAPVSGRRRDTDTPTGLNIGSLPNNRSSLQVSESRPAVRAVTSFDDDIEEVTL